ncbi:MAG: class I tRNA ligase family protein, partial [Candidatus Limnocylindria bacterium]|nr:class I tRNA ligase family protein [Candidatus Limnocylindria bacterium]
MAGDKRARFAAVGSTLDLPALEHGIQELWEREDAFGALRRKNAGGPVFSFIDGPITANIAAMGVHHAWGRTYKDVFQRYKAMRGFDQRYQNGFDCQGLWVEVEVERELKLNSKREIEAYGLDRFADACIRRVRQSADAITTQSARLGMWMDWPNSYYTYSDANISHIWAVLKLCHEKGWLYKGHRSMPWCARCGTALSQHEMIDSYREMTHTSVTVRMPVQGRSKESFLVWTTTPWTLTANVALAVHPDLEYVRVKLAGEVLIVGRKVYEQSGWHDASVIETVKGADLLGLRYRGPFDDLDAAKVAVEHHRVIAWDEVGEEEGTGIVHIAPGCGEADFKLGKREAFPVLVPIDDSARYVDGFGAFTGREARGVADDVVAALDVQGLLFRAAPYTHRYPECWRCHEEIVFRVDDEWFLAMDELRPKLKDAAAAVNWVPDSAGKRMQDWLLNMGDWNISRKRYWGLPLPFYTCAREHFFVIGSAEELRERAKSGLEGLRELHRPWIDEVVVGCPECGADARRVKEVGDCWL